MTKTLRGEALRCRIRNIAEPTEAELQAINNLYAASRGEHLPQPDMQDICDAASEGLLFVVEPTRRGASPIVGVAGLFHITDASDDELPAPCRVYELAGMVLDRSVRGYGLQELLVALRVVALARGEAENVCVLCSVAGENDRSLANVRKQHLVDCHTPAWMKAVHRSWCSNEGDVQDLVTPSSAVAKQAAYIKKFLEDRKLTRINRVTGAKEHLRIDCAVSWLDEDDVLDALCVPGAVNWRESIPKNRLLSTSAGWVTLRSGGVSAAGKAIGKAS